MSLSAAKNARGKKNNEWVRRVQARLRAHGLCRDVAYQRPGRGYESVSISGTGAVG